MQFQSLPPPSVLRSPVRVREVALLKRAGILYGHDRDTRSVAESLVHGSFDERWEELAQALWRQKYWAVARGYRCGADMHRVGRAGAGRDSVGSGCYVPSQTTNIQL
jgi:hypothetical protein